jgi:hypothetical protein
MFYGLTLFLFSHAVQETKLQVLEVLINTAKSSRENRVMMRIVLESTTEWFDDEVEPEEVGPKGAPPVEAFSEKVRYFFSAFIRLC